MYEKVIIIKVKKIVSEDYMVKKIIKHNISAYKSSCIEVKKKDICIKNKNSYYFIPTLYRLNFVDIKLLLNGYYLRCSMLLFLDIKLIDSY